MKCLEANQELLAQEGKTVKCQTENYPFIRAQVVGNHYTSLIHLKIIDIVSLEMYFWVLPWLRWPFGTHWLFIPVITCYSVLICDTTLIVGSIRMVWSQYIARTDPEELIWHLAWIVPEVACQWSVVHNYHTHSLL